MIRFDNGVSLRLPYSSPMRSLDVRGWLVVWTGGSTCPSIERVYFIAPLLKMHDCHHTHASQGMGQLWVLC